MIARLWWKERGTLWPAWPVLFGTGAGLQWVLLASGSEGVRSGMLMLIALCWATLYALVAASAAFAGERETGTLGLLDALPVARGMLWLGKTTFVLASTLGLALVMLAQGYLGSTDVSDLPGRGDFLGHYGTLLFEAVAWGLLWSALLGNPMIAGALALFCVGEVSYVASGGAKIEFISDAVIPARLVMATLALAASAGAIVWRPLAGWSSSWLVREDRADTAAECARPIRPRPASSARVLMWKTKREGFLVWLGATAVVGAALAFVLTAERWIPSVAMQVLAPVSVMAALVTGVGVFGNETATGSQRFLLHLGVGPGPIWSRTMRAWGNGLAVTGFVLLAILLVRMPNLGVKFLNGLRLWFMQPQGFSSIPMPIIVNLAIIAALADAFAIGTLAGMVFRRRITAGMIALLVWLAIAPLQCGLAAAMGMVPPWALLLTPITLLVISRAWAGDWLDARPGPTRWLRLAGYVAVPSVVFSTAYIAHRAWGVPDPGPVSVAARTPAGNLPSGPSDTAATYSRLATVAPLGGMAAEGAGTRGGRTVDYCGMRADLIKNQDQFQQIYRATQMPPLRFSDRPFFEVDLNPYPTVSDINRVAWLVEQHGRGLLEAGKPVGVWEDILALYRMARQLTAIVPSSYATQNALVIDRQATMLALDWAAVELQTPDHLRKALADLRALPPFPTIGDVMKAEAPAVERTLALSGAELERSINGSRARPIMTRIAETMLLYPWWERERARRVCRAEFKRLIAESAVESKPKPLPETATYQRSEDLGRMSPLAARIMSYWWLSDGLTRATVGRRGLVQVIALRAWNLTHEGTYPETLDALVPDLLDRLPLDPFSAQPFGYKRSKGQQVVARLNLQYPAMGDPRTIQPGQWFLFSVGPDRREGSSATNAMFYGQRQSVDDLVFPLP